MLSRSRTRFLWEGITVSCRFKLKINNFAEIRLMGRDTDHADKALQNDWLQSLSKRNIIFDNFSVLNLVIRSTSHVKGHRRGGVCVLWMLLVFFFFLSQTLGCLCSLNATCFRFVLCTISIEFWIHHSETKGSIFNSQWTPKFTTRFC